MLDEFWGGLKENLKKSRNPFFGTFIVTWSVRHWDLYYSVLTFDKGTSLANRKAYINQYFKYHHFYTELIYCAFFAVGILMISYAFMAITRFVKKIYLQNVIPWVNTRFKSKEIKTISEYHTLMSKLNETLHQLEELEARNSLLSVNIREATEKNQKTITSFDGFTSKKDFIENLLVNPRLRQTFKSISESDRRTVPMLEIKGLNEKLKENQRELGLLLYLKLIEEYSFSDSVITFRPTSLGKQIKSEFMI